MPEAPEVLSYYNFIYSKFINKTLTSLNILSGKYLKNAPNNLETLSLELPLEITNLTLHGKLIFIHLENSIVIEISHGMTGYWSIIKEKHSRIEFKLQTKTQETTVYFNDPRNFARIAIYTTKEEYENKINKLGPIVLDVNETNYKTRQEQFIKNITKKKNSQLGILLLDQSVLSGIGNYLRCDILWYIKYIEKLNITHTTRIKDISIKDLEIIFNIAVNMTKFYSNRECNLKTLPIYNTFIYMQEYDIFNNLVKRETFNGRTIHYV